MVSADPQAISAFLTAPSTSRQTGNRPAAKAGTTDTVGYAWVKGLPDLNRQTRRQIGASGAGWTFTTICSLLHHLGRVGRPQARKAARDDQRLSVGVQAIADESGLSVGKVRRDLNRLAQVGIVAIAKPNVTVVRDPATGRIVENRTGRSKATVVFLTVCQDHLRVKAAPAAPTAASPPRMAPSSPTNLAGLSAPDRDHSGGAIQREEKTKRTPDGLADGVGRPQATEAGLTAGDTAGRLTPQARRPQAPQRPPWTPGGAVAGRTAAQAAEDWKRGAQDPETLRRREEWHRAKAAKRAARAAGQAQETSTTSTADEAADRLRRSLDELPDESRQRARDLGESLEGLEDEARRLAEIVERRRREQAEPAGRRRGEPAEAAA